jgi:MFS family permease
MVGIAWLYVLTLYLQEVLGHSALTAGLLFIPMTLASVVAAPVAGRLATRIGVRDDGIFRPRAGGGGVTLDDADVRRRRPALRALRAW